jgi:propionyl-CoA carboxylase alpha chain
VTLSPNCKKCFFQTITLISQTFILFPDLSSKLKVISYSPTSRTNAILGLGLALDQYLLGGVQHNIPFVRDVLRNADFVKGNTPTGFIDTHYPEGFSGGRWSETERRELVAIAREIQRRRERVLGAPPLALVGGSNGGDNGEDEVVVCLGGMFGDAYLVRSIVDSGTHGSESVTSSVTKLSTTHEDEIEVVNISKFDYEPSNDLAHVKIAGENRALQVSKCLDRASVYCTVPFV